MSRSAFQAIKHELLPRLQSPREDSSAVFVSDQLEVGLVRSNARETVEVTAEDVASWGVSMQHAFDVAFDNLRKRSSKARWQEVDTVPGMSIYLPGDGDAASRALIVSEIMDVPPEGLMFAVPTHDQLVVVRLADADALEAMRVLVNVAHLASATGPKPLTDQLFWHDGEKVVHVPVRHGDDDNVDIVPPPGLLEAVERIVSASLLPAAVEA